MFAIVPVDCRSRVDRNRWWHKEYRTEWLRWGGTAPQIDPRRSSGWNSGTWLQRAHELSQKLARKYQEQGRKNTDACVKNAVDRRGSSGYHYPWKGLDSGWSMLAIILERAAVVVWFCLLTFNILHGNCTIFWQSKPGYVVCCCNNSFEDIFIILGIFILLYGFYAGWWVSICLVLYPVTRLQSLTKFVCIKIKVRVDMVLLPGIGGGCTLDLLRLVPGFVRQQLVTGCLHVERVF